MFVLIALAITLIILIYFWQKKAYNFWLDRGIVQGKPIFPIGTLDMSRSCIDIFEDYYKKFNGKSKYVGLYTMFKPTVLVIDEEVIKQIFIKDFNYVSSRGMYYNEVDDPLSAHLFSIDGEKWRTLRHKLSPTFTSGKMKAMCPIVVDIGKKFKETMDLKIENHETGVDMRDMFARFTIDVIGTCAFGLECNSLSDPKSKFREMGDKVFTTVRYSQIIRFVIFSFQNVAKKLHAKTFSNEVSDFFIGAVNDSIQHRVKNNINRHDFLDLMIGLWNRKKSNSADDSHMDGLSLNEIAAQCFVFFLAGFETSSTASTFTIYELSKNQAIQDKLRSHIREVLKKYGGELTYEALKDMTYLEQCVNESLRMYSPLLMLNRQTIQEYKLPDTDVVVPKDTPIIVPIYSIHHDPRHYPEPFIFNPDRFSADNVASRHPFTFLPFGGGPRNCIGERFGMMQAKIGLTYLIGNYRFTLNHQTKPIQYKKDAFLLALVDGLYFDVEKIK